MIKELALSLMLAGCLFVDSPTLAIRSAVVEQNDLVLEGKENGHYKVIGVQAESIDASELRIRYSEEHYIDEISAGAFDDCTALKSLMISYTVTLLPTSLFTVPASHSDFANIFYTGSQEEWENLDYNTAYSVAFDACDEGFIRMWNREVRPLANSNLCDLTKAEYDRVIALYENLSEEDRDRVNATTDLSGAEIVESISFLKKYFQQSSTSYSDNREVSSSTMISFVIVIAVVGMTFIMVFYYLKDKNIIQ
ncbi:MAG TPA: hypothetical protein PKO28_04835 [Bacilli bacterium]|nr:hypothetical protein [Bacilli bacterium]